MNVATALNKKYLRYTAVMLKSLCENNPGSVRIFLLNHELSAEDVQRIQKVLAAYDAQVVDFKVDRSAFYSGIPYNEQWSIETYYRLLLLDLLPKDVERLLYLDGDIIVNRSLKELYELDFKGKDLYAGTDSGWSQVWEKYSAVQKELLAGVLKEGHRYFNAGVMLLNIGQMREQYSFRTYCDVMESWNYQMFALDQDILNYVHAHKTGYFDERIYNLSARTAHNQGLSYEDMKQAAIIHYTGYKPWEAGNCHYDIEKRWWDYARRTPFYQELLEEFLDQSLTDGHLEAYIQELLEKLDTSQKQLQESLGLNQRLLAMLQKQ